jgi:hypothetical protein
MLPPPRPCPREQRCHDAITSIQPRGQIRHSNSHFHGRAVAGPRDVHEPKLGLDHDVVASSIRVRTRLAVTRDGSIYEPRVDAPQRLVVHAVLLQRPREVILDEDVALGGQPVQDLDALLMLEG